MDNFEGIEIRKIEPIEDEKGVSYEWCKGNPGLQVTVYVRNKGIHFADHYHKGDDPSKNPEKFFLAKGRIKLNAYNGLKNQYLDETIEEGHEIIIFPDILHSFEALTDVVFLEYRSTVFDRQKPDTYLADSYERYIKSKKGDDTTSINTNWYVLTGGPCSGKTKTIEYLNFLGYSTVLEAARILINSEIKKGKTIEEVGTDEYEFQRKVLEMKMDAENRIPPERITFFDRGIPDSVAYYKIYGLNPDPAIKASQKRRYKRVFFLEQLPFEKDYARIEDEKMRSKIDRLIYDSYSDLGYSIIRVPVKPIDERADFILETFK